MSTIITAQLPAGKPGAPPIGNLFLTSNRSCSRTSCVDVSLLILRPMHALMTDVPEEKPASIPGLPTSSAHSIESTVLAGKRIVIVEDEGVTQLQLRRSLTRMGLVIAGAASTGESGTEAVLRERPDLVLMDIRLAGEMDGLEAARRILAEYPVCIILLTAYAVDEYRTLAEEIGTCGYLLKPVVSETLRSYLEQAYTGFHSH